MRNQKHSWWCVAPFRAPYLNQCGPVQCSVNKKKPNIKSNFWPLGPRWLFRWSLYLSEICARGVGAQQFALHVLLDALDHAVLVQEVHLVLGGVDVDVDVLRRDLQAAEVWRVRLGFGRREEKCTGGGASLVTWGKETGECSWAGTRRKQSRWLSSTRSTPPGGLTRHRRKSCLEQRDNALHRRTSASVLSERFYYLSTQFLPSSNVILVSFWFFVYLFFRSD